MRDAVHSAELDLSPRLRRTVELAARWYVFIFLNNYGLGKIAGGQFYRRGHLPADVARTTLGQAGGFDLAWTFMGHSFAYILFIGLAEVLGAWLLLWNRTKLLGVAVLFPVMVNILVFDVIFFEDGYGAVASATIYTLLLVVIVLCNRERVRQAIAVLTAPRPSEWLPSGDRRKTIILALLAMAVLLVFDQVLTHLLGYGRG